jgi:hypothetical protein
VERAIFSPQRHTIDNTNDNFIDSGSITCCTSHARVRLRFTADKGSLAIINHSGEIIGAIACSSDPPLQVNEEELHELIVLSGRKPDDWFHVRWDSYEDWCDARNRLPLYVMLITRDMTSSPARKDAIGIVNEEAWVQLERAWEFVILDDKSP